jgi:hypothetical protein
MALCYATVQSYVVDLAESILPTPDSRVNILAGNVLLFGISITDQNSSTNELFRGGLPSNFRLVEDLTRGIENLAEDDSSREPN